MYLPTAECMACNEPLATTHGQGFCRNPDCTAHLVPVAQAGGCHFAAWGFSWDTEEEALEA